MQRGGRKSRKKDGVRIVVCKKSDVGTELRGEKSVQNKTKEERIPFKAKVEKETKKGNSLLGPKKKERGGATIEPKPTLEMGPPK